MNHIQPDQASLSEDKPLQQARLSGDPNILDQLLAPPEATSFGIAARVIDVLEQRIGKASLAIRPVASDLSMSTRTLQRRLQEHNLSFASLRDHVRFRHAVHFLKDTALSVDGISRILDFSDRTSFTSAFKRWTGMSPTGYRRQVRQRF
ncbi:MULTISPECIES: helix-turn-helix domain-containing protein [Microbulbifer]|jgi:AraC-like DNA-binding protein|uniref:AraC-like DNA-binding protein n=6 Tax=Microbulbifer TaxID=48073 RepID=A0A6P1TD15_9GAMM|nr:MULTISPECIES: helix-turn-helix domain-containing protein [Microbulbifer]MBB5210338.1 AraC-like DNA-binding protein [Microbulbifer hydrolyticus]MCQ3830364.1 AraC family transcriptional regulator [Microbulbifer elongatus]QHQ39169.1 helix-turn-helix domain-containing protein [Microbulbifer hydrolyticus]QIL89142.1 helix-turn-helix domain-containing protein [Microbulbifer sp. SH-1]QKX18349.1 AraC family transcriptional regulator [Microbulbifer sp. YPW1]